MSDIRSWVAAGKPHTPYDSIDLIEIIVTTRKTLQMMASSGVGRDRMTRFFRVQRPFSIKVRMMISAVIGTLALSSVAAQIPAPTPPKPVSWYGDRSAPDISGVWVRDGVQGGSASKEGWLPWPPPLKPSFAAIWQKRLADAAAGKRLDDPVRGCLPAGMPRFDTGMTGPMMIMQTPGRVVLYRDGMPVRRVWVDGRPLPAPADLESFSNGNATGRYVGSELLTDVAGIRSQPIDSSGVPHSDDLRITERFRRIDAQTLRITVTLTDKTAFTRPITSIVTYKLLNDPLWEPREFLCTPETNYAPENFVH